MNSYAGRSGGRWNVARWKFKMASAIDRRPCAICGRSINYSLSPDDPEAFTALAMDLANLFPAHARCHGSRGPAPDAPGQTTK